MSSKMHQLLTLFIFILISHLTTAQLELNLQHKIKTHRTKSVKLDREFYIGYNDTVYVSKIIDHQANYITIIQRVKLKDTTVVIHNYRKKEDTFMTYPIFGHDTLQLAQHEIEYLKKDLFKNREWLVPCVYFGMTAVAAVLFLPLAIIDSGKQGFQDWAGFEALLTGLSFPEIFIGTRKVKYDLRDKWEIVNSTYNL